MEGLQKSVPEPSPSLSPQYGTQPFSMAQLNPAGAGLAPEDRRKRASSPAGGAKASLTAADLASIEGFGLKSIQWELPTDIQLAEDRIQFRNLYGYASDFLNTVDLFGERKSGAGDADPLSRRGKGKDA